MPYDYEYPFFGPLTPERIEEINQEALRRERDKKLAETDFLLMPDYPASPDRLAKIKAYRQALRDLPQTSGAPWDGGGPLTPWPVME